MRPFKTGGKKVMKSQKTIKPAGFYKDIKNIAKELIRAGNWTKFAKDHERAYRAALKYFSKKRLGDMKHYFLTCIYNEHIGASRLSI